MYRVTICSIEDNIFNFFSNVCFVPLDFTRAKHPVLQPRAATMRFNFLTFGTRPMDVKTAWSF